MTIRFQSSGKAFSRFAGLPLFRKLANTADLPGRLAPLLPSKGFSGETSPAQKFLGLVSAFACGADCLDDVDVLTSDAGFAACTPTPSASRLGEFLKAFDPQQLRQLQAELIRVSLRMREQSHGLKDFHLILDSTKHEQFGLKQEGVDWSYAPYRCLDSLQAYDEHGYPYWFSVRAGKTHTAHGATEVISAVLGALPQRQKPIGNKRFVLADSGYYGTEIFNACALQNAKFVIAARETVYGPILEKRSLQWNSTSDITFFDGRACEIAETVHTHPGCRQALRIVIVRALKPDHENGLFKDHDFDYAAFVTNIGMHEMNAVKVLRKYRMRANGENFIREMKNGVNLRRFQCKRLVSNNAFALAAAFAQSLLRFMAHVSARNGNVIHFAKRLRNALIHIPCQVVKHGREVTFRLSETHHQEVERWLKRYHDIKLLHAASVPGSSPPLFEN